MSKAKIAVSCAKIRKEMGKIEKVVDGIDDRLDALDVAAQEIQRISLMESIALHMHDFYTGCEKMFREIAKNVDQEIPGGTDWHHALLEQMNSDLPQVRPAVLSDRTYKILGDYLGFRHVLRNVYTFELDEKRTLELAEGARKAFEAVAQDLTEFCEFGTAVASAE